MVRGIVSPVTGVSPDSMIWLEPLNITDAPVVFDGTVGPAIVMAVPRTLVPVYAPPASDSAILPTVLAGFEKSRLSLTETVHVEEMDETFRVILVESILVVPGVNAQLEIPGSFNGDINIRRSYRHGAQQYRTNSIGITIVQYLKPLKIVTHTCYHL